jgi:hypothetical protein
MRRPALLASALLLSAGLACAQVDTEQKPSTQGREPQPPTALPTPKAEPANDSSYGPPVKREEEGPSDADRGPAQKHFILVSTTDDLEQTQVADNASLVSHDKMALDKNVSVSLVHEIEDSGHNPPGDNPALRYEVEYLNWGATTQEQLHAREGHYFTITWKNHGPRSDFTTRFEYRQVKSKEIVRTIKEDKQHVAGSVRSYFGVVDKAYLAYGPIYSWRFTIFKGDAVVAQTRSFVW